MGYLRTEAATAQAPTLLPRGPGDWSVPAPGRQGRRSSAVRLPCYCIQVGADTAAETPDGNSALRLQDEAPERSATRMRSYRRAGGRRANRHRMRYNGSEEDGVEGKSPTACPSGKRRVGAEDRSDDGNRHSNTTPVRRSKPRLDRGGKYPRHPGNIKSRAATAAARAFAVSVAPYMEY